MTREHQERLGRVLAELSELYPDWRLGQIVANVVSWARGPSNASVWDISDEEFLTAAEIHVKHRMAEKSRAHK